MKTTIIWIGIVLGIVNILAELRTLLSILDAYKCKRCGTRFSVLSHDCTCSYCKKKKYNTIYKFRHSLTGSTDIVDTRTIHAEFKLKTLLKHVWVNIGFGLLILGMLIAAFKY